MTTQPLCLPRVSRADAAPLGQAARLHRAALALEEALHLVLGGGAWGGEVETQLLDLSLVPEEPPLGEFRAGFLGPDSRRMSLALSQPLARALLQAWGESPGELRPRHRAALDALMVDLARRLKAPLDGFVFATSQGWGGASLGSGPKARARLALTLEGRPAGLLSLWLLHESLPEVPSPGFEAARFVQWRLRLGVLQLARASWQELSPGSLLFPGSRIRFNGRLPFWLSLPGASFRASLGPIGDEEGDPRWGLALEERESTEVKIMSGREKPVDEKMTLEEAVAQSPVELKLELARLRLSASALASLVEGEIIDTGLPLGTPLSLMVGAAKIGEGELVDVEGHLGVRVTSLVEEA